MNGGVIPARLDDPAVPGEGEADVEAALDNIFDHPNLPPFIARRLIQRLVTSNPSPGYTARVAAAFASGVHAGFGTGRRGDLAATWAAVLLDPEARGHAHTLASDQGRLQEPFVRLAHLLRFFRMRSEAGFPIYLPWQRYSILQEPLTSPSVFNFYLPDHRPGGPLAREEKYGPEFQLLNASSAISLPNQLIWKTYSSVNWDGWGAEHVLRLDLSPEEALAHDADALVRHLDGKFGGGRLSAADFAVVRDIVERHNWPTVDENRGHRVRVALNLLLLNPATVVVR